ncbi:Abi family protein [Brevibacterium paucivorans]|uniref:Abi family protein n=1 Tax=Brevibacterium paucivorans TaxID=170994 RepID=UPI0021556A25|nr:Abi family protein [Brevibacterium paucivorans]
MSQASKIFKSHGQQIDTLRSRGMSIEDEAVARRTLERVNYYRLSGYWYPYREMSSNGGQRLDSFINGTSFEEVLALYEFDERLRAGVFTCLIPIELALRSALGHELGRIDPLIHLKPNLLGPVNVEQRRKRKRKSLGARSDRQAGKACKNRLPTTPRTGLVGKHPFCSFCSRFWP